MPKDNELCRQMAKSEGIYNIDTQLMLPIADGHPQAMCYLIAIRDRVMDIDFRVITALLKEHGIIGKKLCDFVADHEGIAGTVEKMRDDHWL